MSYYSDPTHALLAKIAQGIDRLSETIEKQPHAEGSLLASTLAENIRLKEMVQKQGEELLTLRMDASQDPTIRAVIIETYLQAQKK